MNSWCAPGDILKGHTADELSDFNVNPWPAGLAAPSRDKRPEVPEALSMPTHYRIWLNDDEGCCPPWPDLAKKYPEQAIELCQPGPWVFFFEGGGPADEGRHSGLQDLHAA